MYIMEEIVSEYENWEDYKYSYISVVNLKKIIPVLYFNSCITLNNLNSFREEFIMKISTSNFMYPEKDGTDKYSENRTLFLSDYYVKKSNRFSDLCKAQPQYNNFIQDIENHFKNYLINLNFMKKLFKPTSIVFDLANNYSYETALNIIIQRMHIEDKVVPIDSIVIENLNVNNKVCEPEELFSYRLHIESKGGKILPDFNNLYMVYHTWITNGEQNNFKLIYENIDNDYSQERLKERTIEYVTELETEPEIDTLF